MRQFNNLIEFRQAVSAKNTFFSHRSSCQTWVDFTLIFPADSGSRALSPHIWGSTPQSHPLRHIETRRWSELVFRVDLAAVS